MRGEDKDLEFLFDCTDEELDPMVQYITKAFSNFLDIDENYKKHHPQHSKYVETITHHFLLFGGNTLINIFRDHGPNYSEIVEDVCSKMGVKIEKHESTEDKEKKILLKIIDAAIKKMSVAEKAALTEEFLEAGVKNIDLSTGAPLAVIFAQAGINFTGFLAYRMAVIVANSISKFILKKGLTFAANASLTRSIAIFAGPIGWVISGVWTVIDLAGPAFRVTIPCVCHVAYLRQKKQFEKIGE
jgi:uncharacterized protein YaaW (UPF0174 family)